VIGFNGVSGLNKTFGNTLTQYRLIEETLEEATRAKEEWCVRTLGAIAAACVLGLTACSSLQPMPEPMPGDAAL